ncbi:MAG: DciA family protein [Pseudazoarcus pumilus]|nr:DciA family protein [Pseudazoarcus pumilus]
MNSPIQRFLGAGDTLSRLQDHARSLMRAQEALRGMLPQALGEACSVANIRDGNMVVFARNGSVAARLRQMVPSLINGFATRGQIVNAIQVKVGVVVEAEAPPPREARVLGQAGRDSLASLIAELPEDAPLRESLQRLLDRSRPQ